MTAVNVLSNSVYQADQVLTGADSLLRAAPHLYHQGLSLWHPLFEMPLLSSASSWLEHCFFRCTSNCIASLAGPWSHSFSRQLLISALNYYTLISKFKFQKATLFLSFLGEMGGGCETSLLLQWNLLRALYKEQTWVINIECLKRQNVDHCWSWVMVYQGSLNFFFFYFK